MENFHEVDCTGWGEGGGQKFLRKNKIKCETPLRLFFLLRAMVYRQKKSLQKKKVFLWRQCKNYWITHSTHMMSHAVWVDERADVMVSIRKINKN